MNNENVTLKKRQTWCDIVRGICSLAVILSHIEGMPNAIVMYFTPITLPGFFVLSGYFTKNYGGDLPEFLYNKVLKELILRVMFCFCMITISAKVIANLILHPSTIPEWIFNIIVTFLMKPTGNFFSILVLCSVYFIIVNILCRDKPIPMMLAATALATVGYIITRERIINIWNWDTALVCVFFYIFGYVAKQTGLISKWNFKPKHAIISGGVFFTLTTVFALTIGVKNTEVIIANNTFLSPFVSVPLFASGIAFIISFAHLLPCQSKPVKLLMYIGRHSMIYFMIGGPVLAYVSYFCTLLYQAVHWEFLQIKWIKLPFLFIVTVAVTLIPSLLSDRFFPALNGRIRLPEGVVKKHPKICIAVCASLIILGAGIIAAAVNGMIVPNRIYARHYPIHGVDVSSYQGKIDWHELEAQNVRFAYIKATEGSGHVDKCFSDNWRAVSETDIKAGAYHFFSFESTGKAQADNFIFTVPVASDTLPPVVDLEYYGNHARNPLPAGKIVPELRDLLDALEKHYGKRPVIYVAEPSYLQYIYTYFDDYDIWFRNILTDPPGGNWRFWQYTNREHLKGYDGKETFIDMNVFLGTEEEWESFLIRNNISS